MLNLIFYKESENLRDTVSDIHFSTRERVKLFFPANMLELEHLIMKKEIRGLLYYFSPSPGEEEIRWLNYYSEFDPDLLVSLFADRSHALTAWKSGVFHFEAYPILSSGVVFTFKKYNRIREHSIPTYSVRTPEGIFKLRARDIYYIHAAGNYTLIQLRNEKNMVLTRQLGTYSDLLEIMPQFERVHRSLILNKSAVRACRDQKLYFHQSTKTLEISAALESRLKKKLSLNA